MGFGRGNVVSSVGSHLETGGLVASFEPFFVQHHIDEAQAEGDLLLDSGLETPMVFVELDDLGPADDASHYLEEDAAEKGYVLDGGGGAPGHWERPFSTWRGWLEPVTRGSVQKD